VSSELNLDVFDFYGDAITLYLNGHAVTTYSISLRRMALISATDVCESKHDTSNSQRGSLAKRLRRAKTPSLQPWMRLKTTWTPSMQWFGKFLDLRCHGSRDYGARIPKWTVVVGAEPQPRLQLLTVDLASV
jgi:hypothetical protein